MDHGPVGVGVQVAHELHRGEDRKLVAPFPLAQTRGGRRARCPGTRPRHDVHLERPRPQSASLRQGSRRHASRAHPEERHTGRCAERPVSTAVPPNRLSVRSSPTTRPGAPPPRSGRRGQAHPRLLMLHPHLWALRSEQRACCGCPRSRMWRRPENSRRRGRWPVPPQGRRRAAGEGGMAGVDSGIDYRPTNAVAGELEQLRRRVGLRCNARSPDSTDAGPVAGH